MFGYIAADTRKLNKEQLREYRSVYCGLCHALGRRYGALSRIMLSFDTAFLLTLLQNSEQSEHCSRRCPYKLGKKHDCVAGDSADYCADITVLLFCLKLQDDIDDDGSLRAKILLRLFKKQFKKAKEYQPLLAEKIKLHLARLREVESADEHNPDIPANIFGELLADVFAKDDRLGALGFALGRFIYLADAACDFKSDIKHGNYNPLVRKRKDSFYNMLAGELGNVLLQLDGLEIKKHRDIIENVLYHGVWIKINVKGIYDTRSL